MDKLSPILGVVCCHGNLVINSGHVQRSSYLISKKHI